MEECTWTVYCLTDKVYGKKYVGITSGEPKKRWNNGSGYKESQPLIHNAIKDLGWENFEKEILMEGLDKQSACEAERKYIKEFNSRIPNGYNLESGGMEGKHLAEESKKLISEKAIKRLNTPEWKNKLRVQNTGERNPMYGKRRTEENKDIIRRSHFGKKHSEESKKRMKLNHADFSGGNNCNSRPVIQFTLDGKYVAQYDSISEATNAVGHCDIFAALSGKTKTAGGYKWTYAELTDDNSNNGHWRLNIRPKWKRNIKVVQFDLEGNVINEFERLQDAADAMRVGKSSISRCCLGKTETIRGFVFQYK